MAAELAGAQDQILRTLEEHLSADIFLRGNVVTLDGDAEAVQLAATVVRELSELVARGHEIGPATIESVARVLDQAESPSQVLDEVVWRHRNLKVAPKSVNQKRYTTRSSAPRSRSGSARPAPARRSWRWPWPPPALSRREVNRIILTRPAVEAGERLGFLPGDLMAKVDPYLRPLFDALHDMMDAERVAAHLERGVIEVAPLAFMRGRAQPVDRQVLTPDGLPARSGRCGSATSWSAPTAARRPVLGVYPQGRKPVFRVEDAGRCCRRSAAASTCGSCPTPDDRKRGKPGRVLQTQRHDRAPAPAPSAPLRAAAGRAPVRVRAARRPARPLRARPPARRRVPDRDDDARRFATADPELADGARGGARRASSCAARARSTTSCSHTDGRPRRRHRREPRHRRRCASSASPGTRSQHEVRPGRVPAERVERPAGRAPRTARHRRRAGHADGPELPDPVHDLLAAGSRDDVRLPGPVARRRRLLADARSRRTRAGSCATGGPSTTAPTPTSLDIRLPAGIEPFRLSAQARHVTRRHGGGRPDALHRAHRAGRRGGDASASRSPPRTRSTSPTTSSSRTTRSMTPSSSSTRRRTPRRSR